jgi:hypothetical protein
MKTLLWIAATDFVISLVVSVDLGTSPKTRNQCLWRAVFCKEKSFKDALSRTSSEVRNFVSVHFEGLVTPFDHLPKLVVVQV